MGLRLGGIGHDHGDLEGAGTGQVPVLVVPFDDDEDAIRLCNESDYGLGGAIFTRDADRGLALARQVQSGSVGVNHYALPIDAPFGGVKNSGIGRELGPEGLAAYLETKAIYRTP